MCSSDLIRETDRVAKLVPEELGIKLKNALKKSPDLKQASEDRKSVV